MNKRRLLLPKNPALAPDVERPRLLNIAHRESKMKWAGHCDYTCKLKL